MSRLSVSLALASALTAILPRVAAAQTQAQAPNPSFYLMNNAGEPIRELFATPSGRENWGQNRIAGHPIPAGGRYAVRMRADGNCVFDMKVTFASGQSEERKGVDTCKVDQIAVGTGGAGAPAPAATHEASLRLINRGKSPITEVHATPANANAVADNLLQGGATVAPQASQEFHLPPNQGCSFDLRVVFANQQSREKKNTDLCKTADLPVQ